jgi:DNA-binding transcriptional LysR family regulator
MDRFRAMSVFRQVVESGSLSAAGRRLGMPLPTVSRSIAELEAHLNTRLLIRSTRHLALTDAGRTYLSACKQILDQIDEAERGAAGEYSSPKGELTLTAPVMFGRLHVLPVIYEFLRAYPDIDIRLTQSDRIVHLLEDHIDLAVRIGPLPDSELIATRLGSVRHVVCASAAYLAMKEAPATLEDLATHDCITFEGLRSPNEWVFGAGRFERSLAIRSRLVVNTADAAIGAAIGGIGITRVLSYQVTDLVKTGAMSIILQQFEPEPWPVHLVYGSQGLVPLKLRAFLDFATPRLKQRLAAEAA